MTAGDTTKIGFIKFKAHDTPTLSAVMLIIVGILIFGIYWLGSRSSKPTDSENDGKTPAKTPISRSPYDDSTDIDDPITIIKPKAATEVEVAVTSVTKAVQSIAKR